jgi:hypothetical protein
VIRFNRRLSAVVLSLALLSGNGALCAGWAPTPEARMACCSDEGACPMHRASSHSAGAHHAPTQAQADNCCVSSERDSSRPSNPIVAATVSSAVLGPGTALPPNVPALVLSDKWRIVAPIPSTPVPKHLLLSVFLV